MNGNKNVIHNNCSPILILIIYHLVQLSFFGFCSLLQVKLTYSHYNIKQIFGNTNTLDYLSGQSMNPWCPIIYPILLFWMSTSYSQPNICICIGSRILIKPKYFLNKNKIKRQQQLIPLVQCMVPWCNNKGIHNFINTGQSTIFTLIYYWLLSFRSYLPNILSKLIFYEHFQNFLMLLMCLAIFNVCFLFKNFYWKIFKLFSP